MSGEAKLKNSFKNQTPQNRSFVNPGVRRCVHWGFLRGLLRNAITSSGTIVSAPQRHIAFICVSSAFFICTPIPFPPSIRRSIRPSSWMIGCIITLPQEPHSNVKGFVMDQSFTLVNLATGERLELKLAHPGDVVTIPAGDYRVLDGCDDSISRSDAEQAGNS
jgi:hypothetical protein